VAEKRLSVTSLDWLLLLEVAGGPRCQRCASPPETRLQCKTQTRDAGLVSSRSNNCMYTCILTLEHCSNVDFLWTHVYLFSLQSAWMPSSSSTSRCSLSLDIDSRSISWISREKEFSTRSSSDTLYGSKNPTITMVSKSLPVQYRYVLDQEHPRKSGLFHILRFCYHI
jgi:hypothetical protein